MGLDVCCYWRTVQHSASLDRFVVVGVLACLGWNGKAAEIFGLWEVFGEAHST